MGGIYLPLVCHSPMPKAVVDLELERYGAARRYGATDGTGADGWVRTDGSNAQKMDGISR